MATYVVGDIQGCFEPFMALLAKLKFNPDTDRLWSVGDLVNRGPGN
ncbi:MAG: diadenosine tetraphosphatase, partial [Gammaproteobacteria bacterium]|nr:diadenosine tetraphosphatase [Gammaproteobacteria bacterium]